MAHGTLHMLDASLHGSRSANPLRGFAPDTTHHVGMSEGLWGALGRLCNQRGRHWLGDARMEGGSSTGNDANVNLLITGTGASGFAGCRSDEGAMVAKRGSHEWQCCRPCRLSGDV